MKILKDYIPVNPTFFTEEEVYQLGIPAVLFEDCKNEKEIFEKMKTSFEFSKPESQKSAYRYLDNFELTGIRDEYTNLFENELPVLEDKLAEAKAKAKQIIADAVATYNACETQIKDLASQAHKGTKQIDLPHDKTFRIAYKDKYLFYSIISGKLRLCAVTDLPESDKNSWMSSNEEKSFQKFLSEGIQNALAV